MRHGSGKAVGALEAQSAVWVDAVVEAPPFLDQHPGLCHAEEHLLVGAFVPEPEVEALDLSVLPRPTWIDIDGADAPLLEPALDVPGSRPQTESEQHSPPSPSLEAPANQGWKSNFLAINLCAGNT